MSWQLYVRASTERAASKVAARVAELLDQRLEVHRIEPYWKIDGQRVVSATLALRAEALSDAVVEALTLATAVAGGWHVNRPEEHADGWYFDGWASGNFRVAGVEFATWTLAPLVGGARLERATSCL